MAELLNSKQIWLLAYENPLAQRMGSDFFKLLPKGPGIYRMLGREGELLYVGKAKNLKDRLSSYKQVKPGQSPRKVLRLIRLIAKIEWEECETEERAFLRENELLRKHHPPFNVLNTHPENYYFIGFKSTRCHFNFCLTTQGPSGVRGPTEEFCLFGAFKGRSLMRDGYGALLRLLWASLAKGELTERFEFPSVLVRRKVPYVYSLYLQQDSDQLSLDALTTGLEVSGRLTKLEWERSIHRFLKGTSMGLLEHLTKRLLEQTRIPSFMNHYIQENLEILKDFYEFGPRRNYRLKKFHGIKDSILPQDQIDDLLVTYRMRST